MEAIEITTFKLNGYSCSEFITANADIDAFLKRQAGFQSRYIVEKNDGTIVDMLVWDSVENGTNAMHRLMDEMAESPVHEVIDQSSVSWNIYPVQHSIKEK